MRIEAGKDKNRSLVMFWCDPDDDPELTEVRKLLQIDQNQREVYRV